MLLLLKKIILNALENPSLFINMAISADLTSPDVHLSTYTPHVLSVYSTDHRKPLASEVVGRAQAGQEQRGSHAMQQRAGRLKQGPAKIRTHTPTL